MTLDILYGVYFFLFLLVAVAKFKARDFMEVVPSLFWVSLMAVPFWMQKGVMNHIHFEIQAYGILGMGILLLIADGFESRARGQIPHLVQPGLIVIAQSLLIVVGGLQVIHLAFLDYDIQLAHWIIEGGFRPSHVDHHAMLQVLLLVLTPLTLALLIITQRMGLATFFFFFSVFYGLNISLEFGIVYAMLGLVILSVELTHFIPRRVILGVLGIVLVPFVIQGFVLLASNEFALDSRATYDEVKDLAEAGKYKGSLSAPLTQGDEFRLLSMTPRYQELSGFSHLINHTLYEIFLVPSESSFLWYKYSGQVDRQTGVENWNDYSQLIHQKEDSPNQVARTQLASRFPSLYGEGSFVWASADADAYTRFGMFGLFLTIVGAFCLRLYVKFLRVRSRWGDALYLSALFLLGFSLPNAPGAAVVVRYGVGLFALLITAYFVMSRKYLQQDYLPSSRSFD